ncbi:MAG: glycosyltransferase family 2 protein [Thermodesulfobacteriota bacterium]
MQIPSLSIIICTYNRAGFLAELLDSLIRQMVVAAQIEIIVIDNNSNDNTAEVVAHYNQSFPCIRSVFEHRQGLSHARNRGYQEARAPWVAYLDDDARAFPNYVERILHVINNYDFDCFGGVYLPWYKFGRPKWYKDHYGSNQYKMKCIGELPNHLYMDGGNCVFKKIILEKYNGFKSELGMKGNKLAYGEETFLQNKLRSARYKIGFDPELLIEHAVVTYKMKVLWFLKSNYANGRDSWDTFDIVPSVRLIYKHLRHAILLFFIMIIKNSIQLLRSDYYLQNMIIDTFMPLFYSIGACAHGIKILKEKNNNKLSKVI